jgi:hypothetical protein
LLEDAEVKHQSGDKVQIITVRRDKTQLVNHDVKMRYIFYRRTNNANLQEKPIAREH